MIAADKQCRLQGMNMRKEDLFLLLLVHWVGKVHFRMEGEIHLRIQDDLIRERAVLVAK
ncbi:hypothetical protein MKX01_035735, partial [Papaver californicum]